ncbi:helix-turn-helix transcriptional regulator [Streptococcus suis]|uniref:helix-turn-helix transcriptional regulator n=1 Tax=Streptococcus suis TaxID=1307 RepID=UPI001ABDFF9A|nr:helix-turn-helix transcriptional regulator [Streptococcus suis]MBO4109162.1 helix-turn-helix transcriptional regulator [Streptococcus suis]
MNRLKILRKEKGDTQDQVAEVAGVSKRSYIYWENGERQIKPDKAQKLANHFKVSVGYLLGYSDDTPMTFSSGEEFEKAEEELLKKLQNSDTAELKLSYQGNELTGIEEKFTSSSEIEKDFLHNFSKLEEKDKSLIRYLTEKLVKDNE